jgi:hypothetical protein
MFFFFFFFIESPFHCPLGASGRELTSVPLGYDDFFFLFAAHITGNSAKQETRQMARLVFKSVYLFLVCSRRQDLICSKYLSIKSMSRDAISLKGLHSISWHCCKIFFRVPFILSLPVNSDFAVQITDFDFQLT